MNDSVNFNLAKLLKEKGFSKECSKYYEFALESSYNKEDGYEGPFGWKKGELNLQYGFFINNYEGIDFSNKSWYICATPSISQVIMWLYEKHNIWITVDAGINGFYGHYKISPIGTLSSNVKQNWINNEENPYNTPSEAYEAVIKYSLNNLI